MTKPTIEQIEAACARAALLSAKHEAIAMADAYLNNAAMSTYTDLRAALGALLDYEGLSCPDECDLRESFRKAREAYRNAFAP
ncbi:hypothetical protein [Ralstonia solanacearum]|uniref:hypothetical protein n=1 Tax=Ralstonia solanacearum TaxID=305 RepID=UPI0018D09174|nr:hypothetical protein [Ralstonia solanacearum]